MNKRTKYDSIHILITLKCNLSCPSCLVKVDLCSGKNTDMSIEQIEKFIEETKEQKKRFKNLCIVGGEPTLHPNFLDICTLLKESGIGRRLTVQSNGVTEKTRQLLEQASKYGFKRHSETYNKDPNNREKEKEDFINVNNAPIDRDEEFDFENAKCQVVKQCSFCLCKWGYYTTTGCMGIDRVIRYDLGIKQLKDVNTENFFEIQKETCKYCGFVNAPAVSKNKLTKEEKKKQMEDTTYVSESIKKEMVNSRSLTDY